jgi:tRNA(Ile)-lysidine synthase
MAGTRKSTRAPESRREDLVAHARRALDACLPAGSRIAVGLSGGRDSVVLLDLMRRACAARGDALRAIHVHHGLHPDADAWARYCRGLCRAQGVALRVARVTVDRASGLGLEAAARAARHAVYARLRVDAVVLGHHADDQAETVLLRLLRGAGVHGLAGMAAQRAAPGPAPRLIRPLLDVPRARIEAWAAQHGLAWVEDPANVDPSHDRNAVRHELLPAIERRFGAARTMLARAAAHAREAAALLDDLAAQDARSALAGDALSARALRALSGARARNLLRWWLAGHDLPYPSAAALAELLRQLTARGPGASTSVQFAGAAIRRRYDAITVEPAALPAALPATRAWHGERELRFPETGVALRLRRVRGDGIALARLDGPLEFRARRGGERLRPDARRPRRALKNLFREAAVAAIDRDRVPLLWCGERLVWVAGIGCDAAYAARAGEPAWRIEVRPLRGGRRRPGLRPGI